MTPTEKEYVFFFVKISIANSKITQECKSQSTSFMSRCL